jgi:hypothetical protein
MPQETEIRISLSLMQRIMAELMMLREAVPDSRRGELTMRDPTLYEDLDVALARADRKL